MKALDNFDSYEFILVDNASTDNTTQIAAQIATAANPTIISEPRKGKSFGLNTGISVANGEFIIFIDDDIRPAAGWLEAFYDAASRYLDKDLFVGQIRPDWQSSPPQWLQHLTDRGRSYGCTPIDRPEGAYSYAQAKGANLMVRRSALREGVRFDEGLQNYGASPNQGGYGGEDTKFAYDVLNGRESDLIFIPAATVFHAVTKNEMRLGSVLRRYRNIGKSRAARLHLIGKAHDVTGPAKIVAKCLKAILYAIVLDTNKAAQSGAAAAQCFGEWIANRQIMKSKGAK